ncbi:MAG TPA: hypothetical protein VHZ33_31720 [Trebonia sp.]|nr:hypothetical protein [Trebonia sp.]
MITTLDAAALLVTAAGLLVAALAVARTRQVPLALAVLLDFFTAAALLHLAGTSTWPAVAAAALTLVIRQVVSRALAAARSSRHR